MNEFSVAYTHMRLQSARLKLEANDNDGSDEILLCVLPSLYCFLIAAKCQWVVYIRYLMNIFITDIKRRNHNEISYHLSNYNVFLKK